MSNSSRLGGEFTSPVLFLALASVAFASLCSATPAAGQAVNEAAKLLASDPAAGAARPFNPRTTLHFELRESGRALPSGVSMARLEGSGTISTTKLVLMK
jgi:hypothetical protein